MFDLEQNYADRSNKTSGMQSAKVEGEFSESTGEYQQVKAEQVSFDFDIFKNELNSVDETEYSSNSQMSKG